MSDVERRVRERAYQLWEEAGYPPDRSDDFWYRARQEIESDIPPVGDAPGGAIDFPPDEMSLEDPPPMSVDTGMPFDSSAEPGHPHVAPDAAIARGEPDEPMVAKSSRSVATSAARKAAEVAEEAAPSRRPRTGAARPAASRPAPSRPGRK